MLELGSWNFLFELKIWGKLNIHGLKAMVECITLYVSALTRLEVSISIFSHGGRTSGSACPALKYVVVLTFTNSLLRLL